MKLLRFTFKNEAIWLVIFSTALLLAGLCILFIGWLVRS